MTPDLLQKTKEILYRKYLSIVQERLVAVEHLQRLHNKCNVLELLTAVTLQSLLKLWYV